MKYRYVNIISYLDVEQITLEQSSNLIGNWNVPSVVPRNQLWSGCQIARPTSSSAPNPTGVSVVIPVSSGASQDLESTLWMAYLVEREESGTLVLVGMFRRCR